MTQLVRNACVAAGSWLLFAVSASADPAWVLWLRATVFQEAYGTEGLAKWEPVRDQLSLAECRALLTSETQDTSKHGALDGEYAIPMLPVNTVRFFFKEGELRENSDGRSITSASPALLTRAAPERSEQRGVGRFEASAAL